MDAITVISLGGAVWIILTIIITRVMQLPSQKKNFQKMTDQKLIDYKTAVRKLCYVLIAFAIVASLTLISVLSMMSVSDLRTYFACLLIVWLVASLSGLLIFREIIKTTQSEIEHRKT